MSKGNVWDVYVFLNEYENIMTRQPYKNNLSENYFPENIRQQIKERYGVNVSENPSEEELDDLATVIASRVQDDGDEVIIS